VAELSRSLRIVAERGLPTTIANKLRDGLEAKVREDLGEPIDVSIEQGSLLLDPEGEVHLGGSVPRNRKTDDVVIFLTEMPRLWDGKPTPAEIDLQRMAGIISLPACGVRRVARVVERLIVASAAGIIRQDIHEDLLYAVQSKNHHWTDDSTGQAKSTLVVETRWGWVRTVIGMMRINQPWKLVASLKGVMAAAVATASFGVFYTSIWQMASVLSPLRLLLISGFSVAVMTTWLIAANHMWERKSSGRFSAVWARLYNSTTIFTVLTGVVFMYLGLYVVTFVSSMVVIDESFLTEQLGKESTLHDYGSLAWLATSMGVIAGALGSNADSHESILRATFGRREQERRKTLDELNQDEQDEEDITVTKEDFE
jgi:hypothetical protein